MGDKVGDLLCDELAPAIFLHLDPREDLKTLRWELLLCEPLADGRNTCLALLARLLERGTRRWPDLRRLSRQVDALYGAEFSVSAEQCGSWQALRVVLEIVDGRFLPAGQAVQERAVAFLREALCEPVLEGDGFPPGVVDRERAALAALIAGQRNDGLAFAQRRCVEIMGAGQAWALPVLGEVDQVAKVTPRQLRDFHLQLLRHGRIDLYASGRLDPAEWRSRWREFFDWTRQPPVRAPAAGPRPPTAGPRRVVRESAAGAQGRLVLGYRTPAGIADPDYAALVTLNQLWGADSLSRLFQVVRQREALCYHIASELDAACGIALVCAGIGPDDFDKVVACIGDQLAGLAAGQVSADDLEGARVLLRSRVLQLDEDPAGMAAFDYQHRLTGSGHTRASVCAALEAVAVADVARVAGGLHLDTAYFACAPPEAPGRAGP